LKRGDYVVLEVRDNGAGIEPGVLEKIFDPFFSTKFTGRGLGLAAVHGIIRTNGGAIEVETQLGVGSTFRVFMPAAAKPVSEPAEPIDEVSATSDTGTILIVDDESIVCSTASAALQHAGHKVETVSSGQAAIDLLSASGDRFSMVLLDLNMPGLNGEETFDAIRLLQPDLPIVICSGYSDAEIRSRFANKSINGFLQKPFRNRAICDTVSGLLASRR
jgi:CheY-like chemotaxis protein